MTAQAPVPRVQLGLQVCQSPNATSYRGLGRYVHDHALALVRGHREFINGMYLDPNLPLPRLLADYCGFGLLQQSDLKPGGVPAPQPETDIFHAMSPFEPDIPLERMIPPASGKARKIVVTLYDLIPLIYHDTYMTDGGTRHRYNRSLRLVQDADHVLALSRTSRDDAVRLLGLDPDRISVIFGGVNEYFRPAQVPRDVVRQSLMEWLPDLRDEYILYTGGIDYRKNIRGAIEAYAGLPASLRETYQLVLVTIMSPEDKAILAKFARAKGVGRRVVLCNYVPEERLRELYQACLLFLFPSLYEGMGLPILEAMRCGAPVIVSDRGSMREIVELADARFDPENTADMTRVLLRALSDEPFRQELQAYGLRRHRDFTWQRTAEATTECYRQVASTGDGRDQPMVPIAANRRLGKNGGTGTPGQERSSRSRKSGACLSLRALQGPGWTRHRGWVRYVYEQARQLLDDHAELISGVHIDGDLPLPKALADFCGKGLIQEHSIARGDRLDASDVPGVFHVMSPIIPEAPLPYVYPAAFSRQGTKLVVNLYDLIPLLFEDQYLPDVTSRIWYRSRLRLIQEADQVLSISETTRQDAIRLLGLDPERVSVIYTGIGDDFRASNLQMDHLLRLVASAVPQITGPYILSLMYASEFGRRKNLEGLVEGYAALPNSLRSQFQLVFVGPGLKQDIEGLTNLARAHGVEDRVAQIGLVSDDIMRLLYQACELFVFPSLYEGLGLPILEAMRCGAPVIVSDRPAMNEVVELDDARFDPTDPEDIARVTERFLTDNKRQMRLREYGIRRAGEFTWERAARVTAECYGRLLA